MEFQKARKFTRNLNLRNDNEWRAYCKGELYTLSKKPNNIPSAPDRVYKNDGWLGIVDWLGNEKRDRMRKNWRSFYVARDFVRKLNLNSYSEWMKYCKGGFTKLPDKPDDIPTLTSETYKIDGWVSWGNWFGKSRIATRLIKYRSFSDAKRFVVILKF